VSNKLYKIKPLVWEDYGVFIRAKSAHGEYLFSRVTRKLTYKSNAGERTISSRQSVEAAKAFADDYNAELMREGLEEVTND